MSGGYDHKVMIWTVSPDDGRYGVSSRPLGKNLHISAVNSIAFRKDTKTAYVASSRTLRVIPLEHHSATTDVEAKISEVIHHVHLNTDNPNMLVLEVSSAIPLPDKSLIHNARSTVSATKSKSFRKSSIYGSRYTDDRPPNSGIRPKAPRPTNSRVEGLCGETWKHIDLSAVSMTVSSGCGISAKWRRAII